MAPEPDTGSERHLAKSGGEVLVGLIGAGIGQSLTPAMHMAEGEAQGLRYLYRLLDLDDAARRDLPLAELLRAAQCMGYDGLNVTFPVKQTIIPLLDSVDSQAAAIGAVNTVRFSGGRSMGYNTDAPGFGAGIQAVMGDISGQKVLLLGAGGAGSAAANELLKRGVAHLYIYDREPGRSADLARRLSRYYDGGRASAVANTEVAAKVDGLVHATPTGMSKFPGLPIDAGLLRASLWVAEIVYFPFETELLRSARAAGCRVIHGGYMAVHQAVRAFEIFSGRKADDERMLAHFRRLIGEQA